MATGNARVRVHVDTPSELALLAGTWSDDEPDGPIYTGMVAENLDPFVPAGALKVKIAEAEMWEPPEGCTCVYRADGERVAGRRPKCPVRGHKDT